MHIWMKEDVLQNEDLIKQVRSVVVLQGKKLKLEKYKKGE